MENARPVPVVCALIERAGTVLLARRPLTKHLGGKWEFPGGKVEPGEAPAAAIVREIREELGCAIEIVRMLPQHRHDYPLGPIEMIPCVVRLAPGSAEPVAHEHAALAWAPIPDVAGYDLAEADRPVWADYLRSHHRRCAAS